MKASRIAQKLHKWLGLLVGLQLVIWSVSGFYMVVVSLDVIHGDHLIKPPTFLDRTKLAEYTQPLNQLYKNNPDANEISLKGSGRDTVFLIRQDDTIQQVNAISAQFLNKPSELQIRELADTYYAQAGSISNTQLIVSDAPSEIGSRPLPIWRVDYDDLWGTTLYLSPDTGELVTRRHTLWRIFDFFWMLHIMDYDERSDINNALLRTISIFAFLLVVSGAWYLYFRLKYQLTRAKGS